MDEKKIREKQQKRIQDLLEIIDDATKNKNNWSAAAIAAERLANIYSLLQEQYTDSAKAYRKQNDYQTIENNLILKVDQPKIVITEAPNTDPWPE